MLASGWSASFDELLLAAPEGKAGAVWLDQIALRLTDSEDRERRRSCDVEALRRDGSLIGPRQRQAGELVEQLAGGAPGGPCEDRGKCEHAIEEHVRAIEAAQPRASAAPRLRAELLLAEGRPGDAESLLANACELVDDRALCYRARVMAAARTAGAERMNAAVQRYLGTACTTMPACADAETWIGNILRNRGEPNAALSHFVRAAGMDPSEARWTLVADSASRLGAHGEAVQALQHVLERHGGADPLLQRRIDEERTKALGTIGLP
jgi:tetratricopeptide (TPR) repeat protein